MPVSDFAMASWYYLQIIDGFILATSKKKLRQQRKLEKAKELGINVEVSLVYDH
jgi:hypothetical protein